MTRLVPIQTYVPKFIADWIADEADVIKVSRSYWVSDVIYTHYREQNYNEGWRKDVEDILAQVIFTNVALDGLLASHDDLKLRQKVHDAYQRKVLRMRGSGQ